MTASCPGQGFRKLKVELHRCPKCLAQVEIFSDEPRIRCPKCGEMVYRENTPSCIEWCTSARQCLGEERWQNLEKMKKEGNQDAGTQAYQNR